MARARPLVLLALVALGAGRLSADGPGAPPLPPPAGRALPPGPPAPAPAPSPTPVGGAAPIDATWAPEDRARLAFLEHLGWRVVRDAGAADVVETAGRPGFRATLAEAQAAGDLVLRVPAGPAGAERLRVRLAALGDGIPSRLAWQFRMSDAVARATGKLVAANKAGRFKFPPLLFWKSPWFQFHPPRPEWGERGKMYVVQSKPSAAIEALYRRGALAECYTAQWVASYAAQYEVNGPAAFDEAYRPDEIVIGRPSDIRPTPIGQTMRGEATYPYRALLIPPERVGEDPGRVLAQHGPLALAGLTGIVRAQDETDDANQNLITISISPRACEALARGGIAAVTELGKRASLVHRGLGGPFAGGSAAAEYERLLADPLVAEWKIYVQPFGAVSVADMFRREIEGNEKPVYVLLYVHGREDEFFRRYRTTWERRWARAQTPPAPAGAAPAR